MNCPTRKGSSGAPYFDYQGRVRAIHNEGPCSPPDWIGPTTRYSESWATTTLGLIELAEANGVYLVSGPDGSEPTSRQRNLYDSGAAAVFQAMPYTWPDAPRLGTNFWFGMVSNGSGFHDANPIVSLIGNIGERFILGDFDGVHGSDILRIRETTFGVVDLWVAKWDWPLQHFELMEQSLWKASACGKDQILLVGDFNGDGLDDVACGEGAHDDSVENVVWKVIPATHQHGASAAVWTDLPWGTLDDRYYVGDFTGDGRDDIARARFDSDELSFVWSVLEADTVPHDMGGGLYVLFDEFTPLEPEWNLSLGSVGDKFYIGDFDGDDRDDILIAPAARDELRVSRSTGDSFASSWHWGGGFYGSAKIYVGNYDGDHQGREDVAFALESWTTNEYVWWVRASTGAGFAPATVWSSGFASGGDPLY